MNVFWKIIVCLACELASGTTILDAGALATNNPYASIAMRNVFGLSSPPTTENQPPDPPDPNEIITPNGIMTLFGANQVLFKVSMTLPAKPATEKSYILREGQIQDGIEVLKISEKKQIVTFNNHGVIQIIPLSVLVGSFNNNTVIFIGNHIRRKHSADE